MKEAESAPNASVDARKAQILRGLMEIALLRLLRDAPEYGLEILERIRLEAGLNVAEGTIYPLLHRLEKGGSISSEWRLDAAVRRPRRYYALTPQGEMELQALTDEWRRVSLALNHFLET